MAQKTARTLRLSHNIVEPKSCCAASQEIPESCSRLRRCLIRLNASSTRHLLWYRSAKCCAGKFSGIEQVGYQDPLCHIWSAPQCKDQCFENGIEGIVAPIYTAFD